MLSLRLCLLFIHPPAHGSEVSPAARNTLDSARIPRASKLLICGPFQKVRVLAQDAMGPASFALAGRGVRNSLPRPWWFRSVYADRYNILCRKLMQEQLYTAASVLMSPRSAEGGEYSELSELTVLRTFITELAGHIAAEGAR